MHYNCTFIDYSHILNAGDVGDVGDLVAVAVAVAALLKGMCWLLLVMADATLVSRTAKIYMLASVAGTMLLT
jgi:hypothetical protein